MKNREANVIEAKGVKVHNLKNISIKIPRDKFIVVTGVSGSGKSSLAFNTLYSEGQRRYVESLSSYTRQFLGRLNKPEADFISGIPPAVAIEQKVKTNNPRSTVGTSTEIYDFIKLLYARIGVTRSPISGEIVKRESLNDIFSFISTLEVGTKYMILSPISLKDGESIEDLAKRLSDQGYSRAMIGDDVVKLDQIDHTKDKGKTLYLVVDRLVVKEGDESSSRAKDSIQTALLEGDHEATICYMKDDIWSKKLFSDRFELDGITFEEPSIHMFNFNNPLGACPTCEGYGKTIGIDEELVVPNRSLSIYEDAVACWRGEKTGKWKTQVVLNAKNAGIEIHKPYHELTEAELDKLWNGCRDFKGINQFFQKVEKKIYKVQNRVMLSRYRGKTTCSSCSGTRLRKEAGFVTIDGKSIDQIISMQVDKLIQYFSNIKLSESDAKAASRLLKEIIGRLQLLNDIGLGYLTINRGSASLSGGESQRINLVSLLGSNLVGSLYVLDEPSIGLHTKDTQQLIKILKKLQQQGNTVLVVEHDEELMKAADQIIDIGPFAGVDGGEIVFQGSFDQIDSTTNSLTADYLTGKKEVFKLDTPILNNKFININQARENNLKGVDVKIPLNRLSVISGVSGSGKSTLIKQILWPVLSRRFGSYGVKPGDHDSVDGDLDMIEHAEFIDQNPIGRSSRSNPVTYVKAYDDIRKLFSNQQLSKQCGFKQSHFSFNVDGGRCPECLGDGSVTVEMQFMADIVLTCEECNGKRFKPEILEVKYKGIDIDQLLNMTINQAVRFFEANNGTVENRIVKKIAPLQRVGLGYLKMGQSSSTLSGGESQRVKLASFLAKEKFEPTMFIFDEPTTGLHFHDISTLLKSFQSLIDRGHTVVVIEHNLDVIRSAGWIVDLGPDGGDRGGEIMFQGELDDMIKNCDSHTAVALRDD